VAIKIPNAVFLIIYLLSAVVQYNDPDTLPWALIYLSASAMCVLEAGNKQANWLPPTLVVISLVGIGFLLPSIIGQVSLEQIFESITMKTKAVEEAREIGGLLLIVFWAGVLTRKKFASATKGH
jgi:hypothetical protein